MKGESSNTKLNNGEVLWEFVKVYSYLVKVERTKGKQKLNIGNVEANELLNKFIEKLKGKRTKVDIGWFMYNLHGLHECKTFETLGCADETLSDLKALKFEIPEFVKGCYKEITKRDVFIKRYFKEKYYLWNEREKNNWIAKIVDQITAYSYDKKSRLEYLNSLFIETTKEIKEIEKIAINKYGYFIESFYKAGKFNATDSKINSFFFHGEIRAGTYTAFDDIFLLLTKYDDKHNEVEQLKQLINEFIKPTKQTELKAPEIRLFCQLINDSSIIIRGVDEGAERYCERVCKKFNLKYTIRVAKGFKFNQGLTRTDKHLRKVIELILPTIPVRENEQIQTYINHKTKTYA